MKKRILAIVIILIILTLLCLSAWLMLWYLSDNTTLTTTTYQVSNAALPEAFSGFRIAQISDLHNTVFGDDNEPLLTCLQAEDPDIIVFTGDTVDVRRTDTQVVMDFAEKALQIAPCYMVKGNHEAGIRGYAEYEAKLEQLGVVVLNDEAVTLDRNGSHITLIGLDDPTLSYLYPENGSEYVIQLALKQLEPALEGYSILLAHHPEWLEHYAEYETELVLSGHAHGGQIRLKKWGGILAPDQGFFPKYDAGQYQLKNTTMILSRGLGNSLFPYRIQNPPELVMIELTP